jgi:flagellar biosynthetic protein FliP
LLLALLLVVLPEVAFAQIPDLNSLLPPGNGSTSGRIIQLMALLTVLSVAPGLLIMVTSFTRFAVALSFLRAGLGLQTTPPNLVLISLAMFMTFYVMAPTFDRAWETGVQPLMKNEISEEEAFLKISDPFREFMLAHVRDKDLQTFESLAAESFRKKLDDKRIDMRVIIPAFMISELRRSFEIGFLIILPFLVIDMIVATLTMSMGMMMMPPTVIALPFKMLFSCWSTAGICSHPQAGPLVLLNRSARPAGAVWLPTCKRVWLSNYKRMSLLLRENLAAP